MATGGGKQPTFRTARAQRTARPLGDGTATYINAMDPLRLYHPEDILREAGNVSTTIFHPSCTTKMGQDDMSGRQPVWHPLKAHPASPPPQPPGQNACPGEKQPAQRNAESHKRTHAARVYVCSVGGHSSGGQWPMGGIQHGFVHAC